MSKPAQAARRWAPWGIAAALALAGFLSDAMATSVVGDISMDRRSTQAGVSPVLFSHWSHRTRFKCFVCHPAVFEMRAGANDVSIDAIRRGRFCGTCHDGTVAFAVGFDTCRNCHSVDGP